LKYSRLGLKAIQAIDIDLMNLPATTTTIPNFSTFPGFPSFPDSPVLEK